MNTKLLLFSIAVLVFLVAGIAWPNWPEEIEESVLKMKELVVSRMSFSLPFEPEEGLEVILPGITTEDIEELTAELAENLTEIDLEEKEEEMVEPLVLGEEVEEEIFQPKIEAEAKVSLAEIGGEVERIERETEVISKKVALLVVRAELEKKTEQERLVDIQGQINELSQQIELFSQEIARLVEA